MADPHIYASTEAWSIVGCESVLVSVWRTEVQLSGIEATEQAIVSLLERTRHDWYGSVSLIEPTMSLRISEEVRSASTSLQQRWMRQMRCSAYVVEGNSFAMAAVRTMTAGMSLLTRSPYPIKSFSDATTAADWVGEVLEMTPETVMRTIARARDPR